MRKKELKDIYRVFAQIMKLSFSHAYVQFHELHIHPAQADLLYILHQSPGITQSDLAKALYIAPSTVAISLNRLEESGYVYREKGDDKRKSLVYLSKKGAEVLGTVEETFNCLNSQLTNTLSKEECSVLFTLLCKVRDGLVDERICEQADESKP